MTFNPSMNSCRRGLRNGVLVNPKLFILEKVNFDQPIKCWSNLVKLSQTWSNVFKLVLFGAGHYILSLLMQHVSHEYMLYVTFVTSDFILRHPILDASKNMQFLTVSEFDV